MSADFVKQYKQDNRGAALVTVLITITVLTILGAILLFMTYTGYAVKVSQAVGENRFYDAETAMDEVRAGLQAFVSDSIAATYTDIMTTFDGETDIDLAFTKLFQRDFLTRRTDGIAGFGNITGLFDYLGDLDDHFDSSLPGVYKGEIKFNFGLLESFITDDSAVLSISDGSGNYAVDIDCEWVYDNPGDSTGEGEYKVNTITLKGLRVTHRSPDGYLSVIDSDITFSMPSLSYARSMYSFRGITDFAFIATGIMTTVGTTEITVDGSAYVGGVNLTGSGGIPETLTLRRGTFISGGRSTDGYPSPNGDINIRNRELIVESSADLWANNIILGSAGASGTSGTLTLRGNTYTAGSLILNGNNSIAILAGRYYGFGTGRGWPEAEGSPLTAAQSSSIIINSRGNRLDLSSLTQLYLAGQSFITATSSTPPVDVLTGQSMAVRSDQLAYLIPAAYIGNMSTNPRILYDGEYIEPDVNYNAVLWGSVTLGDYISAVKTAIVPVAGGNQRLLYVFMDFGDDIENANRYFIDYFAHKSDEIEDYVRLYLDSYTRAVAYAVQSSGVTYAGGWGDGSPGAGDIDVLPAAPGPIAAAGFASQFESRRTTLSRNPITTSYPVSNPFEYVVKTDRRPPEGFYEHDGIIYGYVSHGTLSLNWLRNHPRVGDRFDDIKIIISYGDVSVDLVDTSFNGLILCDGNISIEGDVTAGGSGLLSALRAVNYNADGINGAVSERLGNYLNITIVESQSDSDGRAESWNYNELVYYENWKKN